MASDRSIERLREYLQSLKPPTQAMLIAEFERALLRQDDIAGSELVLQELRRVIRGAGRAVPRTGDAARKFFVPVEPFLFDGPPDHKRIGRLARSSLEPIWEWICRDLMPNEAKVLSEDIDRALAVGDRMKSDQLVRALHECAVQRMQEALAAIAASEKARRRFSIEVGTPRAVDDVSTLLAILMSRDLLDDLARRLPDHFRAFDRDQVHQAKTLLDAAIEQKPAQNAPNQKSQTLLYGLIIVLNRLPVPWPLIRLAIRAAESDDAVRIAATPYAVAVTLVLAEMEFLVAELRGEIKAGRPVASLLKSIHDSARGMRTEMNLSSDTAWSRQLAAICSAASNLLSAELETTLGRVRRLLRPRPANEIVPGSLIDAIDVHDAEARVELVAACRHYAGELAVSEVTTRTHAELTQYLETATKILLDALRHAEDSERPFRHSQLDAAVRFCRTIFGSDYAALLAKAADVAMQGAPAERPMIRA